MVLWAGTTIPYLTKEETETQSAPAPHQCHQLVSWGFNPLWLITTTPYWSILQHSG